ncbi:glycosyltransferase family 4 protein [bacterium]|nr:glycosyltransferase family 4 protein [bacterium]
MKKPEIAILSLHPHNYGGILSFLRVVHKFCSKYFTPTVFFLGFDSEISASLRGMKFKSHVRRTEYFGMKCVEIGARWAFWEPGHYANTMADWENELSHFKYFFAASGTPVAAQPLAVLGKRFLGWYATPYSEDRKERVRLMSWPRHIVDFSGQKFMESIERNVLDSTNRVLALSSYSYSGFIKRSPGIERRMSICGYPVEPKSARASFDNKTIVAIGRFSDPRKNPAMLFEAFDKIYKKIPGVRLLVIGTPPKNRVVLKYGGRESFKQITFTGYVDEQRKEVLFSQASLLLLTSHQEGLGIVGLEALAHGIPVVATDCGGPRDYLVTGKNGYLVRVNDVDDMVNKAVKILESQSLWHELSIGAHEFIRERCTEEFIFNKFKMGLMRVYPDLEEMFEVVDENSSGGAHVHLGNQPHKMDQIR